MPGTTLVVPARSADIGFLHCGKPGELTVNIATHTSLGPDADLPALREALAELLRRAPLLTSRLVWTPRILPGPRCAWVSDLAQETGLPLTVADLPPGAGAEATHLACAQFANLAIDPTCQPPFRLHLMRRTEGEDHLVLITHHALLDGASCGFLFFAIKVLYYAARAGRRLTDEPLPSLPNLTTRQLLSQGLGKGGGLSPWAHGAAAVRGWAGLLHQLGVPRGPSGGGFGTSARSLHASLFFDLRDPSLEGLRRLMASENATLHEMLLTIVSRAFRHWARERELIDDLLPVATTFNLRRPDRGSYPLGNLETALVFALRSADARDRLTLLRSVIIRSGRWKRSPIPWCNALALTHLTYAPRLLTPKIVDGVARRATLLFSYLGTDFATRYLGHYGAVDSEVERLVRDHAGDGVGYVTSAPPMGLVATIKRVRQRVAVNLSIHDRLAGEESLNDLVQAIREEIAAFAALGRDLVRARS